MLVDLTHRFRDGMFSQALFPPVSVTRCVEFEDRRINVTKLDVCVHHGTHIDAPVHFVPGGRSVADLGLEEVSGPAVALDVAERAADAITAADLERQSARVQEGDIVFLHTGWSRWFEADPARYAVHPHLDLEAAQWLLDRRVKLVALDVPSPDMPEPLRAPGFDWPVHHRLLEGGALIAEHVAHLDRVVGRRFRALALPLPLVGADGSPVRMVAELDA